MGKKRESTSSNFVSVGASVWGRGDTEKEARSKMLRAGASRTERALVYRLPDGARDAYVDDHGSVCWEGPAGKMVLVARYVAGKRTEETKP